MAGLSQINSPVSAADAIAELWNRGELRYKLKGKQNELYDDFKNSSKIVNVIASSRRLGKSHVLCTLANEECIKKPGTIVKYIAPTKTQVDEILDVVMKPILEDCPPHLMPEWKEAKKRFVYPNGSQIQIAASDSGHIDKVRGGQASLAIVDEAGFVSDLTYVVQNILIPAVATTKGKIILCSTPNYEDPTHPFNTEYLLPLENAGVLKKFTIYDAPMLDEEAIEATIEAYGGIENPRFRCEFLCEIVVDRETMVFGEFDQQKQAEIVVKYDEKPAFYHPYVSMDIGFKDLTAVLFAYYDFLKGILVIEDEFIIKGNELTTEELALAIKRKEAKHFISRRGLPVEPALRTCDNNNLILVNDLFKLHNLSFIPSRKDNKDAQVNETKLKLRKNQIHINPRCKNLLYHLKSAKWDKNRSDFQRIRENKDLNLPASHADTCDALIYLVRNVDWNRNPYPDDYFEMSGPGVFNPFPGQSTKNRKLQDFMAKIMGINKKGNN